MIEQDNTSGTGKNFLVEIEQEVQKSYLNYAMSVIVSRVLPDVRDGLKPVHRRILYTMLEIGLRANTAYKKTSRIVGTTLGSYHPHGEISIYDALVRLAQDFSLRYPVIQGQGNFGSIDGDPPAASRYTEARLQKIAEELLADINKNTVDFTLNYDDSQKEPTVLPAKFPFILVNGAHGIAVGMATNIPPHNIREVSQAIRAVIEKPHITAEELMQYVTGPDLPTGGTIRGTQGILEMYKTGMGKFTVESKYTLEEGPHKSQLIITEIPYMKKKSGLIEDLARLVNNKRIEGVSDIRDESNRNGIRIVIELKKTANTNFTINKIFSLSGFRATYSANMLVLLNKKPMCLPLKEIIRAFILHRKEVIVRRTTFDLEEAEKRIHIVLGLLLALANIDEIVKIIKQSQDAASAKKTLLQRFSLDEIQAQAILDMRLHRLTSLETKKLQEEADALKIRIADLKDILAKEERVQQIIKDETTEIEEKYGDERRTEISQDEIKLLSQADLIHKKTVVILITMRGYIKRVPFTEYSSQKRGGKGVKAFGKIREEDIIQHLHIGSTHDIALLFSSQGKVFSMQLFEIPESDRTGKSIHIKQILPLENNEIITQVQLIDAKDRTGDLVFATRKGLVKRTRLRDFINTGKNRGIIAITLGEGDSLISCFFCENPQEELLIASAQGKALRFSISSIRTTGRTSRGVKSLSLKQHDHIVGAVLVDKQKTGLFISEKGFAKRTKFEDVTPHARGTQGVSCYKKSDDTGPLAALLCVNESDIVMTVSQKGKILKTSAGSCPLQGRVSRGARFVSVQQGDIIVSSAQITEDNVSHET